jgi:nucleotide-binding universal stress UspA family protein
VTTKSNKSRRTVSNSRSRKTSHFILAVDAFFDSRYQANAFNLAGTLQRQTGCSVEPTFVLSGSDRGLVLGKDDLQHWLRLTDVAFSKLLKNFDSLSSGQPKILVHKSPFIRMDAKTLVLYAKGQNASAIIISTQAKSALERGVLGSFAETLVLHSAVPVIAIPPKVKIRISIQSILFPTDFGPESSAAFTHCVSFAKSLGAKVTSLHEYGARPFTYPEGMRVESNAKWTAMANKDASYAEKTALLERWKVKAKRLASNARQNSPRNLFTLLT